MLLHCLIHRDCYDLSTFNIASLYYLTSVGEGVKRILCFYSVLYCTLLNQAQTDADKQKIIKQMEGDAELLKILRKLQETDKEDIVTEERQRRQAARKSRVETDLDTLDVDDAGVS